MITINDEFEFNFEHSKNSKEVTYFVKMEVSINRSGSASASYEVFKESNYRTDITNVIKEIDFSLDNEIAHKVNSRAMVIASDYKQEAV